MHSGWNFVFMEIYGNFVGGFVTAKALQSEG